MQHLPPWRGNTQNYYKIQTGEIKKKSYLFPLRGSNARMRGNGFTLIELLVVVLIIGILAAVALPQYNKAVDKSRYVQAKTIAQALAKAQEIYYLANGTYSHSFEELDINTPAYIETNDNILDGINRPHRKFSWGHCVLWLDGTVGCYIDALDNTGYVVYGKHATGSSAGQTRCMAYSTDLSSRANQLCQRETGKTVPDKTGSYYMSWTYPPSTL